MAEKSLLENYLLCPVCLETFKDPVSLSCHHSFCSSCLHKVWDEDKNKNCLVCKRKSSKDFALNFSLKELADSYAGRQKAELSKETKEGFEVVCTKHKEEPLLFCDVEQRAVCRICEFPVHQDHKVVPLQQAVDGLKKELKCDLQSLQDRRDKYEDVKKTYNKVVQHSKKQLVATERQIRVEFEKLHQFLREEEEARLAALREEEEQKGKIISREIKIIQDQISSLTANISAVEEELQKEKVSFLTSYKETQTRTRAHCTLPDPQLVSGTLIDVAKHLGKLTFRVWEKMKGVVKFSPVILDPNTARGSLSLSDDLTSVRNTGPNKEIPDNPERMTYYVDVMGCEGFSSGKHSWEVEVGDHPCWDIGVAKESVNRKEERTSTPMDVWAIVLRDGEYTQEGHTLTLMKRPQKIRVQLDCDRGEVSFYDPEDMTHIYTYKDTFMEKIYPFFAVIKKDDANNPDIKICQSEVSLSVMSSS